MAKAITSFETKTDFNKKDEVIEFLEIKFDNVSAKPIIDKKVNILHEYYSNEKKIGYTQYLYDKKDPEKIKFKHKLVLVDNI